MITTSPRNSEQQKAQPEQAALFVSDLHLQPEMPLTTQAFFNFLKNQAMHTSRLYLLGDIFEAWAGDDDLDDAFHARVIHALRAVAESGVQVFWMAGNRDFLVGEIFAQAASLTLLPDPFVTTIAGQQLILTHGDAWCTDDEAYMQFRAQVRSPAWQTAFLALPLERRKQIIEELRAGSRAAQKDKSYDIMDVNAAAIDTLFASSKAPTMIHGHTHRPACHVHTVADATHQRYVLSDWDLDGNKARGDWLAITQDGIICRYSLDGKSISNED